MFRLRVEIFRITISLNWLKNRTNENQIVIINKSNFELVEVAFICLKFT